MIGQMALFGPPAGSHLRDRVELSMVETSDIRPILENFHYLRRCRVGRQINYAVLLDGVVEGVVTYAYPMTSALIDGIPSDETIEFARLYLHHNVPHTASCAIGKSRRRIQADWMRRFPDSKWPRLIVSWSDATVHTGTVYKASGFVWLRRGRGWQGGSHNANAKRGKRTVATDRKNEKACW